MVIDMHVHLADKRVYSKEWNRCLSNSIAERIKEETKANVNNALITAYIDKVLSDYDCERLIAQMDKSGIEKACVLFIDFGCDSDYEHIGIQEVIKIHRNLLQSHGERFCVFMGVHPCRGKKGVQLFEKSIFDYGFTGMKLYPPCGYEINDKRLYPYYEICDYYRLPVLIHIGPSWPTMRTAFDYPNTMMKVVKEFKNAPFVLGHAALLFYEESVELAIQKDNVYLEVSGYHKIKSVELLKERLVKLFQLCPNKILFGSDYPIYAQPEQDIAYFRNIGVLNEEQLERFFYQNAKDIISQKIKWRNCYE